MLFETQPKVELLNAFDTPLENAVGAARTCYSENLVYPSDVEPVMRDRIAPSIYKAGHHTTFQHPQFQFAISDVSRQFVWSFLHQHTFYNSEQQSQRYVKVSREGFLLPPREGNREFHEVVDRMAEAYREICDLLYPDLYDAYLSRFPARKKPTAAKTTERAVKKRAQEVARYVLPVCTKTTFYHTISGVTLMRYAKLMNYFDCLTETRLVIQAMLDCVDGDWKRYIEDPLPIEETPEYEFFSFADVSEHAADWAGVFDRKLNGRTSLLVDYQQTGQELLADAVRHVVHNASINEDDAIGLAIDPSRNKLLSESLNLTNHTKISRAATLVRYVFAKKLSHAADSQNQRHRMSFGVRPVVSMSVPKELDFITPKALQENEKAYEVYCEAIEKAYDMYHRLNDDGSGDLGQYLLPNAHPIRVVESTDLASLQHKLKMRLCLNAQEEIFKASVDEAQQVRKVHPKIGCHLLPPCGFTYRAGKRPICPEGDRFCGVKLWRDDVEDYPQRRGLL